MTTQMISSQLELHRLNTNRMVPVCTANAMIKQLLFRYQGHIGAALILGGVDLDGPHLYCIYPHGSSDRHMYTSMGTGSLAAIAVFESRWKPDMTVRIFYIFIYLYILYKFIFNFKIFLGRGG